MQTLTEIGVSLIAAFLGFLLGAIWRLVLESMRFRRARKYWRPFVKQDLHVVISRFFQFVTFEPSGFIGVGDANALNEMRSYLVRIGAGQLSIAYSDAFPGERLRSNLILLGGPDANKVTELFLTRFSPRLTFDKYRDHDVTVLDQADGKRYSPIIVDKREELLYRRGTSSPDSSEFELTRDYAVIIGMRNPFSPERRQVLVIAGCFGFGTWAGVRFATSPKFLKRLVGKLGDSFEALIEVDIAGGEPQRLTLVVARTLTEGEPGVK